jgi:outer membrane protein assembly factor BamA
VTRAAGLILALVLAGAPARASTSFPALSAHPALPAQPALRAPVLAEIRVQGNVATSDDEVIRLAVVRTGMPVDDHTADEVAARLRATGRFERVEVSR